MRLLLTLIALLALAVLGLCQKAPYTGPDRIEGTLQAFGKVLGPDGRMHSLDGVRFPFVAERIDPKQIVKLRPHPRKPLRNKVAEPGKATLAALIEQSASGVDPRWTASLEAAPALFDTTVYSADHGSGTYGSFDPNGEFADPTSLDDHLMSNGAGRLWQNMLFGVNISQSRVFICRWRVWSNFTSGLGHNVSAFSNLIADFGVKLAQNPPFYTNPYATGAWVFTIDISPQPLIGWPGVSCPGNQIYMAQQFRWPHIGVGGVEDGEGPFDQDQFNIYDVAGPPLVGSSENTFYYDWDDQDGIYAEDEIDVFEAPNYADLLRAITVRGTVETVNPAIMDVVGLQPSGTVIELFEKDQAYVTFKPRWDVARNDPNGVLTVEGVTSNSSVNSLQFNYVTAATSAGGTQQLQFWSYSTSTWVTIDTQPITDQDTLHSVFLTTNISQYIAANRHLKARIRFFPPATVSRAYTLRVDQSIWVLTHP